LLIAQFHGWLIVTPGAICRSIEMLPIGAIGRFHWRSPAAERPRRQSAMAAIPNFQPGESSILS